MSNELEGIWKWSWPNLKYYPTISLDVLRKTMENFNQDNLSPSQDLNPGYCRYERKSAKYLAAIWGKCPC
jgi:hypothetical protein